MKNVVFVYDHLQIGGILTYLLNFFNFIDMQKYSVTLLVKSIQQEALKKLPEGVAIEYVEEIPTIKKLAMYCLHGGVPSILKLLFRRKKSVASGKAIQKLQGINAMASCRHSKQYDVAIGADIYWPTYYTSLKIQAERKYSWIHPQYHSLGNDTKVDAKFFESINQIFAVSEKNAEILKEVFSDISEKIDYIENLVDNDTIWRMADAESDDVIDAGKFPILTVCKFDNSSKRLDRVIDCASLLVQNGVDFIWRIVGDGPDKNYIERLICEKNLTSCVILAGSRTNPYPIMHKSDVFVLLSQYEGVPLVVTEAMILGLPVVVSHYDSAPMQVTEEHGCIVDNDDANIAQQAATELKRLSTLVPKKRICYKKDNQASQDKIKKILGG